jgi:hypothetical protein
LLLVGLGGVLSCDSYSTHREVPPNCAEEAGYLFHSVDSFETVGSANFWTAPDTILGKVTVTAETIPDGPQCGSRVAAVLRSENLNDWGGLIGFNNFGPRNEAAYEGISFWAKAEGNTGRAFSVLLTDANTEESAPGSKCRTYDAGAPGQGTVTTTVLGTGEIISGSTGASALPDQCGNGYTAVVEITGTWRLYTIPFSAFNQTAQPNRVPNAILTETGGISGTGIIPAKLQTLIFRMPKEEKMEIWLDNLSFYKRTGTVGGTDAGALDTAAPLAALQM